MPEWHSGLIYEQLAALNKAAAALSMAASNLSVALPTASCARIGTISQIRTTRRTAAPRFSADPQEKLGQALAALEILGVLSDARSMDFQHDVRFLHDLTYIELEKLCVKHGYTTEEPQ